MKKSPLFIVIMGIALILLSILDLRRGFLFPEGAYLFKSPFLIFSPFQLLLFILGALSLKCSNPVPENSRKKLLGGIFGLLVLDLIIYRSVGVQRSLGAGKVGLDWLNAFGETGLLKTLYLSLSYILTVWHATFLSCLLGGWGVLALPYFAKPLVSSSNLRGGIMGALFSFTHPLCSCCVALTAPSLFKGNIPKSFAISVLIGAPLLNLSTLTLAGALLPWPFFLIRFFGGILVTLLLATILSKYLVPNTKDVCTVETPLDKKESENIIYDWFKRSARLGLWFFPNIILGVLLTSFIWQFWPENLINSWVSVALVSVIGSLLMISTWSEIPLALQFISQGLSGPAAAALIALPAVNLASLLLVGKSTGQWKLAAVLGAAIGVISFVVGICFI